MKASFVSTALGFFREVYLEGKRVSWPSQKQVIQNTALVLGISLGVAVFLGTADFLFGIALEQLAK